MVWAGEVTAAVPLDDHTPSMIIVVDDDFSRQSLGYEVPVDLIGPAAYRKQRLTSLPSTTATSS